MIGWAPSRAVFFWAAVPVLTGVAVYLYIASMFQSCTCHLITRVNKVELTSLFRLRAAREFMALMGPRILAEQGELPPDWLERSTTIEELAASADRNPDAPVEVLPVAGFSFLNVLVFLFRLSRRRLDVGCNSRRPDAATMTLPNVANMISLVVCATAAIVRLSRRKGGRALRMCVLAGLFVVAGATLRRHAPAVVRSAVFT